MSPVNWVRVKLWDTECQNELKAKYNDTDNRYRPEYLPSSKQWPSSLELRSVEPNFGVSKDGESALGARCSVLAYLLDSAHLERLVPFSPAD